MTGFIKDTRRACRGAAALVLACIVTPLGAATPDSKSPDARAAWDAFLTKAEADRVYPAFTVLDKLGYGEQLNATKCAEHAAELRKAVETAPVSIAMHRTAMRCAEATGDTAGAELEMQQVAALAKLALAGASDSANAAPIRVLHFADIFALIDSVGLQWRYKYYERTLATPDFPLVVATWDPERKVERHLRFDWMDTAMRLSRDPKQQFPGYRVKVALETIEADVKGNGVAAIDVLAIREAKVLTQQQAIARLRTATEAGGVAAPWTWLVHCSGKDAPAGCADGLVEALLPQAEEQFARPMALLAYAYAQGIGVSRDEASAEKLLDAADARWPKLAASVAYAELWQQGNEEPFPAAIAARLTRAEAAGNPGARFLQIYDRVRRTPKAPLLPADIAYLSSREQNGLGQGYEFLFRDAAERKDESARQRYRQLAADAGSVAAQSSLGGDLLAGEHLPADEAAARKWLERAASGGDRYGALVASNLAMQRGDAATAEQWLLGQVIAYDAGALMAVAGLYASDSPGVTGNSEKAVAIYREISDSMPEARRALAQMLIDGKGTKKDLVEARRLLQDDADKGDHASESLLALRLLNGDFGKGQEAEGRKWAERALAGGDDGIASDYGYWLVYKADTAASRKQGLAIWRKALEGDNAYVPNNLAWALCTSPREDVRDGKAGLEATRKMQRPLDMAEIDTVAACHAAAGDFAQAQALQRDVIARYTAMIEGQAAARPKGAPETESDRQTKAQMQEFEDRLQLYASGKPYVESKAQ